MPKPKKTNIRAFRSARSLECPVCQLRRKPSQFPDIVTLCRHRSCTSCLRRYLLSQISESRGEISCPECPVPLDPSAIRRVLPVGDQAKYVADRAKYVKLEFARRRRLASDPDCRWCPAPDCGYAVIARGARGARGSNPKIVCGREGCGTEFCYRCRQRWHPRQTCDDVAEASGEPEGSWGDDDARPCPRCASRISKEGGCDHMTCAVCGCQFCWRCMKLWSGHLSGCTPYVPKKRSRKLRFWGSYALVICPLVAAAVICSILSSVDFVN